MNKIRNMLPMVRKNLTKKQRDERSRCSQVRNMLRRAWSRDPNRYRTIRECRRDYKGENKRQRFEYQCNMCKQWFKQSEIQVDHIEPCGSFFNKETGRFSRMLFARFCYRLFFGELQCLCKPCHVIKGKEDRLKEG